MPPIPKRKTERAPAVDKLLKPAIAAAIAMLAYVIMQAMTSEVRMIILSILVFFFLKYIRVRYVIVFF